MTSYKNMNKSVKMKGSLSYYEFNLAMSKMLDGGKKFPHVKYINQVIKDEERIFKK